MCGNAPTERASDAGTAVALDFRAGTTIATLVVGTEPEGVAVSPNGRWTYLTLETSTSVSVIDTRPDWIEANLLVEMLPPAVAWAPDGSRAFVTNETSGKLSETDGRTHGLSSTVTIDGGWGKPAGSLSRRGGCVSIASERSYGS